MTQERKFEKYQQQCTTTETGNLSPRINIRQNNTNNNNNDSMISQQKVLIEEINDIKDVENVNNNSNSDNNVKIYKLFYWLDVKEKKN